MTDKIYTIDEIKTSLRKLLVDTDVLKVTLFGSYAKGCANTKSDIDLVIDSNGKIMGFRLFSLIEKIEKIFKKDVDAYEKIEIIDRGKILE